MTTSNDPDEIRRQIEMTRAGLSDDVNALSDKVSPSQIAKRQKEKVTGTIRSVKESIMGSADSAKESTGNVLATVGGAVSDAPNMVASKTKGSPLAAGMIAFGVGLLASSLFPATQKEAQAATALKEKAEPLVAELQDAAKEAAGNLQEPAQNALESVKSTATEAVDTVKEETSGAAEDVKGQVQDAKDTVQQSSSTN